MSLFGILFVVAVVTAIPTFGLSFVALIAAKMWINSNEAKQIAAAAMNAREGDATIAIPYVSAGGVRKFFKGYGTSEARFQFVEKPTSTYVGYVKIEGNKEHVVMVNWSGATTYVTSFMPPYQYSTDKLATFSKSLFLHKIVESIKSQATA